MQKRRDRSSNITVGFITIVLFMLLITYTIFPQSAFRENALWNIIAFVIGIVGIIPHMNKKWFTVRNPSQFNYLATIGILIGVVAVPLVIIASNIASPGSTLLIAGDILPFASTLGQSTSDVFTMVILQPLSETLVFGAVVLNLGLLLKDKLPKNFLFSIILVSLAFAMWHFAVKGAGIYALDPYGTIQFVIARGAPFLLMGIIWGTMIVTLKDYVAATFAHIVTNFIAALYIAAGGNTANILPALVGGTTGIILLPTALVLIMITIFSISSGRFESMVKRRIDWSWLSG